MNLTFFKQHEDIFFPNRYYLQKQTFDKLLDSLSQNFGIIGVGKPHFGVPYLQTIATFKSYPYTESKEIVDAFEVATVPSGIDDVKILVVVPKHELKTALPEVYAIWKSAIIAYLMRQYEIDEETASALTEIPFNKKVFYNKSVMDFAIEILSKTIGWPQLDTQTQDALDFYISIKDRIQETISDSFNPHNKINEELVYNYGFSKVGKVEKIAKFSDSLDGQLFAYDIVFEVLLKNIHKN